MGNEYTQCLYYWITDAEYEYIHEHWPDLVNHFGTITGVSGRYYAKASDLMSLDPGANITDYDALGDINYAFDLQIQYFTRSTEPNLTF